MLLNESEMGGDKLLKACPSLQWSLANVILIGSYNWRTVSRGK